MSTLARAAAIALGGDRVMGHVFGTVLVILLGRALGSACCPKRSRSGPKGAVKAKAKAKAKRRTRRQTPLTMRKAATPVVALFFLALIAMPDMEPPA